MGRGLANEPKLGDCPVCGVAALVELRCKVICANCRTIVQICADLAEGGDAVAHEVAQGVSGSHTG
jgi:hypothetical protein